MFRPSSLLPLSFLALALAFATPAPAQTAPAKAPAPALVIKAVTDRPEATYKPGETARFDIRVNAGSQPLKEGEITVTLSKDGVEPKRQETLKVKDGRATLSGSLDEPGFLLLHVKAPGKADVAAAGAGFSPSDIQPSLPVPADFDSFWAAQKAALAKVEVKPELASVKSPFAGVEAYDVQMPCLGAPVSGYFGRPEKAAPKSLPAILFVHGAGVRSSSINSLNWCTKEGGMLAMDINAHGLPNGKPSAFYEEQAAGALKDYRYVGRDDREKGYFKGMFLRVIRALDFLTAQPEWDGKTLIVYGSSQGGFQAFAAAGLDERVTFFCAGVPAGCDHTGSVVGRINGWPKLVAHLDGKPVEAELQTARYFDNVNFATRARCQGAAVTVGFIDTTCPPTSVYAAYNALTVPKKILDMPLVGHRSTPEGTGFLTEAALEHVRAMRK